MRLLPQPYLVMLFEEQVGLLLAYQSPWWALELPGVPGNEPVGFPIKEVLPGFDWIQR
jgi:hypothetical protein